MSTSPQDTEITLGTGKLLVIFFGLVALCALFFALGYSLGRRSEPAIASAASGPQTVPGTSKPAGSAQSSMTSYKSVEQKEVSSDQNPADAKTDANNAPAASSAQPAATTPADSSVTLPTSAYFVQVAAVSKQDDADALVDALKKKQYPAFIANTASPDKLFHVQVGPFADIKEAESLRARLISDGYNPILKK